MDRDEKTLDTSMEDNMAQHHGNTQAKGRDTDTFAIITFLWIELIGLVRT